MGRIPKESGQIQQSLFLNPAQDIFKDLGKDIAVSIATDIVLRLCRIIRYLFLEGDSQEPPVSNVHITFSAGSAHGIETKDDVDAEHLEQNDRIDAGATGRTVQMSHPGIDKTSVDTAIQLPDKVSFRNQSFQTGVNDTFSKTIIHGHGHCDHSYPTHHYYTI